MKETIRMDIFLPEDWNDSSTNMDNLSNTHTIV